MVARFGIKPAYVEKLDTVRRWRIVLNSLNIKLDCDFSQFITESDVFFTCDDADADKVEEITIKAFGDYAAARL